MTSWLAKLRNVLVGRTTFSLQQLAILNPNLASLFLWQPNEFGAPPATWLHWGCGDRYFEGFSHVDFRPTDPRVLDWDLLDPWPLEQWQAHFAGAFSEDVLEHFFIGEQAYLLCSLNVLLREAGIARILMPSYARLVQRVKELDARPGGFLHDTFGAASEIDAINMGLRFSGHRWLHDRASLARLASACGYEARPTTCAESSLPELAGRNLRDESGSASFATDLHKRLSLQRLSLVAAQVRGAALVETLNPGARLYRALENEAWVRYDLPTPLAIESVACLNVRSANVSSFRDHYYKRIVFEHGNAAATWRLDETIKSKATMNPMTRDQILICAGSQQLTSKIHFLAARQGEYFTLGDAELFIHRQSALGS